MLLINDTINQAVRVYNLENARFSKVINTKIYGKKKAVQFAKPGWQRGLAHLKQSRFLIGTSPATVFEIDIIDERIHNIFKIDTDVRHCIHGLTLTEGF